MKYFFYIFSVLLVFLPRLQAEDYFIHLSKTGLVHKQALLSPNTAHIAGARRPAGIAIRQAIRRSKDAARFERWLQISSVADETQDFITELKQQKLIDYAEPVSVFRINRAAAGRTPKEGRRPKPSHGSNILNGSDEYEKATSGGDTLLAKQWYLNKIHAPEAWQITPGLPDIIVGVIDTGIDYRHPNLLGSFWRNESEAGGIDGVDDDGNGFVDDSLGWDFTDAPRFADGGDYKDPDNDPMDEYGSGHGTQVAGIIAARRYGNFGISGVAPAVRIMNLRAGTASGYLEEDDVARAVIYALDNGARVINMSFGDVVLSRFLRDVIYYAYRQGLVMVASSGNSGDDQTHYPSALKETISVGATDENDYVAGFSTYGPSVDLVAPGAGMFSTAVGGGYNEVNGTSFSAPVVSAVAALILSLNPDYSAEKVRNVLNTSSKDIYSAGWDRYSASGRADALQAVRVQNSGLLQIDSPLPYSSVAADSLWLTGSVIHPDLLAVSVYLGLGADPQNWQSLAEYERRQIYRDTLAVVSLSAMPDTLITLRVQMRLVNDISAEARRVLAIDHSVPRISNLQILPLYDGLLNSRLISFDSDDVCSAKLFMRQAGQTDFSEVLESAYETKTQRFKIDSDQYSGSFQFYVEALNSGGLLGRDDNNGKFYSFELESDFEWRDFVQLERKLPGGYFLDKALDLDGDGKKEILLSIYDREWNFGPLCIYEFDDGHFEKRLETAFSAIPRDAGDVDGDGKSDMLLGYGNRSFLFEAKDTHSLPGELVWSDTTNFWAAGYTDIDGDDKQEIVGRSDSVYIVLENSGDNRFTEIARLANPTTGDNQYGVPKILQADLNNDGRRELIFADSDGDVLVFTSKGDNQLEYLTHTRTQLQDATALLSVLPADASAAALFVASHTPDDLAYENEFDARRWSVERFRFDRDTGALVSTDTLNIFGYRSLRDFDSGLKAVSFGDVDYLFSSCYPNLHIFRLEEQRITPVWQRGGVRSNSVLVDDFDGDGQDEFYVNSGSEIIAYARDKVNRPVAPFPFSASALDSQRIRLKWGRVSGARGYVLYRGLSADSLRKRAQLTQTAYTDTCPQISRTYYYAVSALDSLFSQEESAYSRIDSATTSRPPRLSALQVANERQLILQFNEPVQLLTERPVKIRINQNGQQASSALVLKNQRQLLAGFSHSFSCAQTDTVYVDGVFDLDGVPLDADYRSLVFQYEPQPKEPYVKEARLPDRYTVLLTFSEAMEKASLLNLQNYRLSPSGEVLQVLLTDSSLQKIEVRLSRQAMGGALGKAAYLELENISSKQGVLLQNGNKITLFTEQQDLARLRIYPQPVRPGQKELVFANLPEHVEIRVYNMQGRLVKTLNRQTSYGGLRWNLKDDFGKKVRSGIYMYRITYHKQEKTGKLVIIR